MLTTNGIIAYIILSIGGTEMPNELYPYSSAVPSKVLDLWCSAKDIK